MEQIQTGVSVRKREARGRLIISVTEKIPDDELTARAEKMAISGGDLEIERTKEDLAERSVLGAVKQKAPEAFVPEISTTIRLDSDHDVDPFQ